MQARLRSRFQHLWIDQRVVDDGVGLRERMHDIERKAANAARPGAGEPDMARFEDRSQIGQPRDGIRERHKESRPRKRR